MAHLQKTGNGHDTSMPHKYENAVTATEAPPEGTKNNHRHMWTTTGHWKAQELR